MKTPVTSRLFTPWTNPSNGVISYVLTARAAPVQKNFYYTNPSMTADGCYLWLTCMYPPPGGRQAVPVLAVVDFILDELRVYHETQHRDHSAVVDDLTGEVYWANGLEVWKRGPAADDRASLVNRFPAELARGRTPDRLATHLTLSPDRRFLSIDARFGQECFLGEMPVDGGPFRLWQRFEGWFYDHAQFNPMVPGLQLFAHEYWADHAGEGFDGSRPYHRMWLLQRGGVAEPLLPEPTSHSGHEWWDHDGQHVWFVHYGVGVFKVNVATREKENLWPGHLSHADSDQTGRYLVADQMEDHAQADCHVCLRDTVTGRELEIVNRPRLPAGTTRCVHLHPHPQFCGDDRYICYTAMIHERVDLALTRTRSLIEQLERSPA